MTIWWPALIIGSLLAVFIAFVWVAIRLGSVQADKKKTSDGIEQAAEDDVEHIFNETFREELRNRGRLHFEKIISENAMFLQQDLRLTTSQLNEYMKEEITKNLQDEFKKYEQSITDAKQMAIDALKKTNEVIDEQRAHISEALSEEVKRERDRLLMQFESNMADIVNHYVVAAIGNQIDLSDQLEYILNDLHLNKEAILEDIRRGA
ncbi:MAG: hypothetical protein QG629_486 [Patescibacteria group bacterium]|nr:hypothetical protein [Candidatus Saccharibacteria bacterium]MDQ5963404.1 hypothetical protein [Patescibacteria group bacterium]